MRNALKAIWRFIRRAGKDAAAEIARRLVAQAKDIARDRELLKLASDAAKAALDEGLTGEKAWVAARDRFADAAKRAGKDLGDCAIDTILQSVYSAIKP